MRRLALMSLVLTSVWSAALEAQDNTFNQALETGEFAVALQIATGQEDLDVKQEQLQSIVQAQAIANERGAMIHTLMQQPIGGGFGGGGLGGGGIGGGAQGGLGIGGQGQGGNAQADFETLIELITSTIEPDTWEEVGGPGAIDGFPGGVYVDAEGTLRRVNRTRRAAGDLQRELNERVEADELRRVSLPRLERAIAMQIAKRAPLPAELRFVAGLERIEYVVAYPETGDLVIAGPATENMEDGIRLEDLVVAMRSAIVERAEFGCSIDPVKENLAKAQEFLNRSARSPIQPSQRGRWLERLRSTVGQQNIRVFGIQADTSTALALVEADYHMKLVGMGLEPAPEGVENYLDSVELGPDGQAPPMDVLRWWFALDYDTIETTADHSAFRIDGQGAKVLSENELLRAGGARQATGRSSALNSQFATSFSNHFAEFVDAYPVYRRLRGIFDSTMAATIIQREQLANKIDWEPTLLISEHSTIVPRIVPPTQVETVINHRVLSGQQIVAGVSGGVMVQPSSQMPAARIAADESALLQTKVDSAPDGRRGAKERWWW